MIDDSSYCIYFSSNIIIAVLFVITLFEFFYFFISLMSESWNLGILVI